MSSPRQAENWYQKAAERMVRENKSLIQVANEMELPLRSIELLNVEKTKAFQQILWTERNKFHQEIASDPQRTKNVLLGQMTLIVNRLMEEGKWKDAAEAILKLAKIEGYVGTEGTVSVFAGLSDKQLREIEEKVSKIGNVPTNSSNRTPEKVQ